MDLSALHDLLRTTVGSVSTELMSPWFYLQLGIIVVTAAVAWGIASLLRAHIDMTSLATEWPAPLRRFVRVVVYSAGTAVFALLTLVIHTVMVELTWPHRSYLLLVAANLAFAWLIIRLATSVIRNEFAVQLLSVLAWAVAALSILGLLDPTIDALDSVAIVLGGVRLTPLLVIKAAVFMAIALWLAGLISAFLDSRITRSRDLTPSLQVLLSKMTRLALIALAIAIVMGSVGINLSSLAIFSSAIGVGIGFGLQKIVGNFVSGIILLTDKSVKPGDLVTVGDSFGRVSAMKTRYISVAAGDGREFLIPNEDLVTQKVVNWTYADKNTLVKVAFTTSFDANPRNVCKLAVEIASQTPRVLTLKPPTCLLSEFGDNGMKFALTFWIADPDAGMDNVRSDVLLALWDAFGREGIHVPSPVRDVRITGQLAVDTPAKPQA